MSNKEEHLVLYPTDTSQWYALVNEAQVRQLCHLDEELESYLVFLLMRYTTQPQMLSSVLALDFLESRALLGSQRFVRLRDLGDKSLLFAGLFPGVAQKRRVNLDYFVDLGQSAYAMISLQEVGDVALFANLCHAFRLLQDLLNAMRYLTSYPESLIIGNDPPQGASKFWPPATCKRYKH